MERTARDGEPLYQEEIGVLWSHGSDDPFGRVGSDQGGKARKHCPYQLPNLIDLLHALKIFNQFKDLDATDASAKLEEPDENEGHDRYDKQVSQDHSRRQRRQLVASTFRRYVLASFAQRWSSGSREKCKQREKKG